MPGLELKLGTVVYDKFGPDDGRPVVFVHGYSMGRSLWRPLAERLAASGFLCLAATWPLGAHTEPMRQDAELTIEAIAAMVAEQLDALSLEDVVLVGNDTGGAIAQVVATSTPERLGALVLTSCDAFENYPPPILRPLITLAKWPPAFTVALQLLRTRVGRERGFGALAHADIDDLVSEWVRPALRDARIREDLRRLTASMRQETIARAASRLSQFTKPTLIAWSADDVFFGLEDGRRLATALPNARLEDIDNARTFSMIDRPDQLAGLVADFAGVDDRRQAA
jgi:pimeloyl-ACP methyl ester carboxylesterase